MKTFLNPLNSREEEKYLRLYKEHNDLEAKNILIERNLRLVAHIVKKYQGTEEISDLISIGTIGLIKAINTFDSNKGSRLATYAARCIDNELLMMLRAKKKTSREISLYDPIGNDSEGNEINLLDILESSEKDICEQILLDDDKNKLYTSFEKILTKREQLIIQLRYGLFGCEETTQKDIAKQLGISRSYVSRIEKKALEKLHTAINQI